jgi:hypothetical protein
MVIESALNKGHIYMLLLMTQLKKRIENIIGGRGIKA